MLNFFLNLSISSTDDLRDIGYIFMIVYLINIEMFTFYKNLFVQQYLIFINQRLQNIFTEYQRRMKLKLYIVII